MRQMYSLALQGQIESSSLICEIGTKQWIKAKENTNLATFFQTQAVQRFGEVAAMLQEIESGNDQQISNFVLIFEFKNAQNPDLQGTLMGLGQATELVPTVWVLSGCLSVGSIRNALSPFLTSEDSLFVVDASSDKLAWTHIAPELDAKIRKVWNKRPQIQ